MALNYLDYIMLAILALFMILGFRKGIIIGLATIAALILGIYIAAHFSNYLDATLIKYLHPSKSWLPILSFAITFILVIIGVMIVAKLVEKVVDLAGMGFFNHLGGALLGLVKGLILLSVLVYFLGTVDPKGRLISENIRQHSFFYSKIAWILPAMMKKFGGELKF